MTADTPVMTKGKMYRVLERGAFGNTITQYFDLNDWLASDDHARYQMWGVRTLTPGGPNRTHCPRAEVKDTACAFMAQGHQVNISAMVDGVVPVTLWADVYENEQGLRVYGVEHPPKDASRRRLMPSEGRQHNELSARMLLKRHLNANSLADLEALLERWPDHVVELSACARCFGNVPGRNAIIWEVRLY